METSISKRLRITENEEDPPLLMLSRLSNSSLEELVEVVKSKKGGETRLKPGKLAVDAISLKMEKIAEFVDPFTIGRLGRVCKAFRGKVVIDACKRSLDFHHNRYLRKLKLDAAFKKLCALAVEPNTVIQKIENSTLLYDYSDLTLTIWADKKLKKEILAWGNEHFVKYIGLAERHYFVDVFKTARNGGHPFVQVRIYFHTSIDMVFPMTARVASETMTCYDLNSKRWMLRTWSKALTMRWNVQF